VRARLYKELQGKFKRDGWDIDVVRCLTELRCGKPICGRESAEKGEQGGFHRQGRL